MAQNWKIDPRTGDYVLEGGKPVQSNSLQEPAYFRLKTKRTQWLYAQSVDFGSDFYLLTKRQTNRDASRIETIAANALQPIADDGRASSIEIETVLVNRNAVGLQVTIEKADGQLEELILPSLGV